MKRLGQHVHGTRDNDVPNKAGSLPTNRITINVQVAPPHQRQASVDLSCHPANGGVVSYLVICSLPGEHRITCLLGEVLDREGSPALCLSETEEKYHYKKNASVMVGNADQDEVEFQVRRPQTYHSLGLIYYFI